MLFRGWRMYVNPALANHGMSHDFLSLQFNESGYPSRWHGILLRFVVALSGARLAGGCSSWMRKEEARGRDRVRATSELFRGTSPGCFVLVGTVKQVTIPILTDHVLRQGKDPVLAIEARSTIEPSGPLERAAVRLLLYVHKRRLRGVVEVAPSWMVEENLSASEHIGDDRAVLWLSEN